MSVMISDELFKDLIAVHICDLSDFERSERIKCALKAKIDSMERRATYTAYKTATNPDERERARQRYLDSVGIPEEYRL